MKKTIVYKILLKRGLKLVSWSPPIGCEQTYKRIGKNKPKIPNSKIFAFSTLSQAIQFDKERPGKVIYKCEAEGVYALRNRVNVTEGDYAVRIFWEGKLTSENIVAEAPFGTVGCDSIKLLRKVTI